MSSNNNPQAQQQQQQEAQAQEERKRSIFGWLWDNLVPSFDIGDLLIIGLLVAGAYFFARNNPEFINSVMDDWNLDPETRATIQGITKSLGIEGIGVGADLELLASATPEKAGELLKDYGGMSAEEAARFAPFTADYANAIIANDGKDANGKPTGDIKNPSAAALRAFILKRPDAIALAASMGGESSNPIAKNIAEKIPQLLGDKQFIAQLVNDPAALTQLAAGIQQISGIEFAPGALETFIRQLGVDKVQQLAVAMLQDESAGKQAILDLLRDTPADQLQALLKGAVVADASSDMATAVALVRDNPKEVVAAVLDLKQRGVPVDQIQQIAASTNPAEQARLATALLFDPALAKAMAEGGLQSLAVLVKDQANKPGASPVVKLLATQGNLEALLSFQQTIAPNMSPAEQATFEQALAALISGDKNQLTALNAETVSTLVKNNERSIALLLGRLDITQMPTDSKEYAMLGELKKRWGDAQQGLAEVMSDKEGVQFVIDSMTLEVADMALKYPLDASRKVTGINTGSSADIVVAENFNDLTTIQKVLKDAGASNVQTASSAAPLSAPTSFGASARSAQIH
jgi:hypothetical protein